MRTFVAAWVCVVAWPGLIAAAEPFGGRFAIEGADSAGARYTGTLELRGDQVLRRVRVGEQWLEHRGRVEVSQEGAVLRLRGRLAPQGETTGLAGALGGAAAPGDALALSLTVWREEGRLEGRLEAPGWAAEERGTLEVRRFDLRREVRSELPADARLLLAVVADAGSIHLDEEGVLRHQEAGGEVRRSWERLRLGAEEVDVRGVVERLRVPAAGWERGYELVQRSGGERAARKRVEGSFVTTILQWNAPVSVFFAERPVAPGESWSIDPSSLRALYKVDRMDLAASRAQARLVAVEDSPDGPRYRVAVRVELATLMTQGVELEPGSVFRVEHELTQSRTRHEIVSVGRLQGRQRRGPALDQRVRTRFEVTSLGQ